MEARNVAVAAVLGAIAIGGGFAVGWVVSPDDGDDVASADETDRDPLDDGNAKRKKHGGRGKGGKAGKRPARPGVPEGDLQAEKGPPAVPREPGSRGRRGARPFGAEPFVHGWQMRFGTGLAEWPEVVPGPEEPDGVLGHVRSAIRACALDVEIVAMECTEPPCIAVLHDREGAAWDDTCVRDRWVDVYGQDPLVHSVDVACGERTETAVLVSPGWTQPEPAGWEARLDARREGIARVWACEPPEATGP